MKRTVRYFTFLFTLCIILASLSSCDSGNWRNDVAAADLSSRVESALPAGDGFESVSNAFISASSWGEDYADYMKLVTEYRIFVSSNSDMNVDEVGVFRTESSKDAAKIKSFVEEYLKAKKLHMTPLLESYNQAELPKLECAEITVCGNYVLYTILNAADTTKAHSAFESELQPE